MLFYMIVTVVTEEKIQTRMTTLRTQYTKLKKSQRSGSAANPKSRKSQWMLKRLQFLNPYLTERKSTSNLTVIS